ncbi:MAG: Hsp70 family protein [Deltaproteobacteria bacterium]|jgi:hypothetical protein|nr:Hsp70 family protein [Deltaproteobacteria bacterium]
MAPETRKDVVGVDFGTTNTYITVCPYGTKNKMPLHLDGRTPAIDTAILYSDAEDADPAVFPMVGEAATLTFGQAGPSEAESQGYRYYANFKLEIVRDPLARTLFLDFFRAISRDAERNGTPLEWDQSQVLFGAPSEAPSEYREALKALAKEAGLGDIEILDEPQGALLTDLGYGRFPLTDVLDGYLVVDFGGGTCDFAFLREGEVEGSWGDMDLGGRLFDDLFFQWFLDHNPGALDRLKAQNRDFYALSYLSRRLKEDFSETVSRNPKASFRSELGRFGVAKGLSRGEFLERASSYSPSPTFLDYQGKFGRAPSGRLAGGKVDLLAWFSEALSQGLGDPSRVRAASLAGGSSRWFFVAERLRDMLGDPRGSVQAAGIKALKGDTQAKALVRASPNPFGAISEGLSILPAVKLDFEAAKRRISADREAFFQNSILRHVREQLGKAASALTGRVLSEFFDGQVAPALRAHIGGPLRIGDLEDEVGALAKAYNPRLVQLAQRALGDELSALYPVAQERIQAWLQSHNLSATGKLVYGRRDLGPVSLDLPVGDQLAEPLFLALGGIASTLVGVISASVCGGAGMALLASGPAGLVLGAAGGAALSGAVLLLGKGRLLSYLKERTLPPFLAGLALSDTVLRSARERLRAAVGRELDKLFGISLATFAAEMDRLITAVLDRIGIVNVFLEKRLPEG